ncbi:MAG: UDP-glucose dehydrogenase family protein [Myxococcota bacterium]
MDLSVIGTGYVGLVAGTCLAEMGHNVVCIDKDESKIRTLEAGGVPIYEPRLKELISHNREKQRLRFTTDISTGIEEAEVIFIAVGTPMSEDGSADVSMVLAVAEEVGRAIKRPTIVVTKSTVPVGTAARIKDAIQRVTDIPVDVVSNPEFMKEGAAVDDFMKPDRIILGCESQETRDVMSDIYAPFNRTSNRVIFMDTASAEMTKYVSNAMLATRISFMNEMANLCERLGADVAKVRLGVGSDPRIGSSFLFPGVGFGGSCFPKDIRALRKMGEQAELPLGVLTAVDEVNDRQKTILLPKIEQRFGADLTGLQFAVWGLAFKPQTDDMREAPSLRIIEALLKRNASVRASDPEALGTARVVLNGQVSLVEDQYEALRGADAMVLVTEWNEYRRPDFRRIKALMKQPVIFDGRNVYNPDRMRAMGFDYACIGRA